LKNLKYRKKTAEKKELQARLKDEKALWKIVAEEINEIKKEFGFTTVIGKRRTIIGQPPSAVIVPLEAMIEREPITVVCSTKGWIRALRSHTENASDLKYKEGDVGKFVINAQTTDKLVIFATNGRFYTINCDKLPGGRGHGEPLRLMIGLDNEHDPIAMFIYRPDRKLLVVSDAGRGFIVGENDVIAQTKNGKQILNLGTGEEGAVAAIIEKDADHVVSVGQNRKLLIFPIAELPEMTRGRGNYVQRFAKGGLADAKAIKLADGLSWKAGERTRTEPDMKDWLGKRAQAGLKVPRGFSTKGKFS
jgi:topoisomerase-4 subunit A